MTKRCILWILITLMFFGCVGCTQEETTDRRVQVSLVQDGNFFVPNNGVWVEPGHSAFFDIFPAPGYAVLGADYPGPYRLWEQNDGYRLELENIRFPQRVHLNLLNSFRFVVYSPNGGTGSEQTRYYDVTWRPRPNTSNGKDMFFNPGHTLYAWGTEPDGGELVGLGSRVSIPSSGITLYAQWAPWNQEEDFLFKEDREVTIIKYVGQSQDVVIPEFIHGKPVTVIGQGAFSGAPIRSVIFPSSTQVIEDNAFRGSQVEQIWLFDNIEHVSDRSFIGCENLQTLHINAIEAPFGFEYRRESMYADKVDMLINAQGQKKLVFYAGCSMWYNLNGTMAQNAIGDEYKVINMGLNGTVSSWVQLQIMDHYLEPGDVVFHTPEISSPQQMLQYRDMSIHDTRLWCGIENNYDLFALVDLRTTGGVFDSLCHYLNIKDREASYDQFFRDRQGNYYMDTTGSIFFHREVTGETLQDLVALDIDYMDTGDYIPLHDIYHHWGEKDVRVYVSYACIDMQQVPFEQQGNVEAIDHRFHKIIEDTGHAKIVSSL